jgi:hypothetical protein
MSSLGPSLIPEVENTVVRLRLDSSEEVGIVPLSETRKGSISIIPTSTDYEISRSNSLNEDDDDLIIAVQKKISELEVENERILWSLSHDFSCQISDGSNDLINTKTPVLDSSETDQLDSKEIEKIETMKLDYSRNLITLKSLRKNV